MRWTSSVLSKQGWEIAKSGNCTLWPNYLRWLLGGTSEPSSEHTVMCCKNLTRNSLGHWNGFLECDCEDIGIIWFFALVSPFFSLTYISCSERGGTWQKQLKLHFHKVRAVIHLRQMDKFRGRRRDDRWKCFFAHLKPFNYVSVVFGGRNCGISSGSGLCWQFPVEEALLDDIVGLDKQVVHLTVQIHRDGDGSALSWVGK